MTKTKPTITPWFLSIVFSLNCTALAAQIDPALFSGILENDLAAVESALARPGMDVNATDENGATPMLWACYKADLDIVQRLYDKGAGPRCRGGVYLDEQRQGYYGSPLAAAVGEGKVKVVQFLLETAGVGVDEPEYVPERGDMSGWRPIHWALDIANPILRRDLITCLFSKGKPDVWTPDGDDLKPMDMITQRLDCFSLAVLWDLKGITEAELDSVVRSVTVEENNGSLIFRMENEAHHRLLHRADLVRERYQKRGPLAKFLYIKEDYKKVIEYEIDCFRIRNGKKTTLTEFNFKSFKFIQKSPLSGEVDKGNVVMPFYENYVYLFDQYLMRGKMNEAMTIFRKLSQLIGNNTIDAEWHLEFLFDRLVEFHFQDEINVEETDENILLMYLIYSYGKDTYSFIEEKPYVTLEKLLEFNQRLFSKPNQTKARIIASMAHAVIEDSSTTAEKKREAMARYWIYCDTLIQVMPDEWEHFEILKLRPIAYGGFSGLNPDGPLIYLYEGLDLFKRLVVIHGDSCSSQNTVNDDVRCQSWYVFGSFLFDRWTQKVVHQGFDPVKDRKAVQLFFHSSLSNFITSKFIGVRFEWRERAWVIANSQGIERFPELRIGDSDLTSHIRLLPHLHQIADTAVWAILINRVLADKNPYFQDENRERSALFGKPRFTQYIEWCDELVQKSLSAPDTAQFKDINNKIDTLLAFSGYIPDKILRNASELNAHFDELTQSYARFFRGRGDQATAFLEYVSLEPSKQWFDNEANPPKLGLGVFAFIQGEPRPYYFPLPASDEIAPYFNSTSYLLSSLGRGIGPANPSSQDSMILPPLLWPAALDSVLQANEVRQVFIMADGYLHRVPLAGLRLPNGKRLFEQYQLKQVLNHRIVPYPDTAVFRPQSALLMGGVNYQQQSTTLSSAKIPRNVLQTSLHALKGDEFPFLPYTLSEVQQIGSLFKTNQVADIKIYTDSLATETRIKSLSGASPQILHIASHGFYLPPAKSEGVKPELPAIRTGLLLAGASETYHPDLGFEADGILTAYEISQLDLSQTELVVLSACETGLGDILDGEGVYGLQRAFKLAGARFLLMSLWKIDDAGTAAFMVRFYENLFKLGSVRMAFHATQREMSTHPEYSDPYYWSGFILVE